MANIPNFLPEAIIGPELYASAYELLARCAQSLGVLEEAAINQSSLADIEVVIVLTANAPYTIARQNRDYVRIWAANAALVQIDNLVGFVNFTLAVGWNELNLSEGARIMMQGGQPNTNVVFRYSDNPVAVTGL